MISSGRSFTTGSFSGQVASSRRSRSRRPRTLASTRERAGLEDDAADQVGVDRARRLDLAAGGAARSASTIARASSSESSSAVVSSTLRAAPRRGDQALELRARSPRARRRGPSRRATQQEVADELVAAARARRRARPPWRAGRAGGCAAAPAARAPRAAAATNSLELARATCVEPALLLRGLEERPRVGRGATTLIGSSVVSSPARRSRARRSPPRSGACGRRRRAPCRVTFVGGEQAQVGDLEPDLLERAPRLGLDLLASSPRAAAGGRPRAPRACAARCASATCRASARISSASVLRLGRSACGAPRAACAPPRGRGRPPRATARIRSRRSSIAFWIGPNANRLSTKSVIRKQTIVQIISPGVTWISGFDGERHASRRGRRRGSSRAGRRTRPPR